MFIKLKQWYLDFLEKDKKNRPERLFYCFLYILSLIYGTVIAFRNFLYNRQIISALPSKAKIVSVGNLSWSGSGKTPLSIWLYKKLIPKHKVAILRRGYGTDEGKLLEELAENTFSSIDRCRLIKRLESSFDVFILDDGFQYRRLKPDINIVIMGAREFRKKYNLIPAYFFREPLKSLSRANILLLNYKNELKEPLKIKELILKIEPQLKVYFSQYKFKRFLDTEGREIGLESIKKRKLAAFAAIGYPQGFFNKLKELDLKLQRTIIYPDHYELSKSEFNKLTDDLLGIGIKDLIITHKDKYHLPQIGSKLNILIMEVELEIENEESFLESVFHKLRTSPKSRFAPTGQANYKLQL